LVRRSPFPSRMANLSWERGSRLCSLTSMSGVGLGPWFSSSSGNKALDISQRALEIAGDPAAVESGLWAGRRASAAWQHRRGGVVWRASFHTKGSDPLWPPFHSCGCPHYLAESCDSPRGLSPLPKARIMPRPTFSRTRVTILILFPGAERPEFSPWQLCSPRDSRSVFAPAGPAAIAQPCVRLIGHFRGRARSFPTDSPEFGALSICCLFPNSPSCRGIKRLRTICLRISGCKNRRRKRTPRPAVAAILSLLTSCSESIRSSQRGPPIADCPPVGGTGER
jgi:hypothetical protein